jgi:hypothetical protein
MYKRGLKARCRNQFCETPLSFVDTGVGSVVESVAAGWNFANVFLMRSDGSRTLGFSCQQLSISCQMFMANWKGIFVISDFCSFL